MLASLCNELLESASNAFENKQDSKRWGEQLKRSVITLVKIKQTNKRVFVNLEEKRKEFEFQKEKVDKAYLKLENLLYIKAYLQREIRACKDLPTPELNIVQKELGFSLMSENFSVNLARDHELALSRLHEEQDLRRKMHCKLRQLDLEQAELSERLDKRHKFLDDLPNSVTAILNSTLELQAKFASISLPAQSNVETIRRLAAPLYELYQTIQQHIELNSSTSGFSLSLAIGEYSKSQATSVKRLREEGTEATVELNLRLDSSPEEVEQGDAMAGEDVAPPALALLSFRCPPPHNQVTVSVQHCFVPYAHTLPLPAHTLTRAMFASLGGPSSSGPDGEVAETWLQSLCGLQGLSSESTAVSAQALVRRLRLRLQSMTRLAHLLGRLERGLPLRLPPSYSPSHGRAQSVRRTVTLKSFAREVPPACASLSGSSDDVVMRAVLLVGGDPGTEVGPAELTALFSVPSTYPETVPQFTLALTETSPLLKFASTLRALESVLNDGAWEGVPSSTHSERLLDWTFAFQWQRLLSVLESLGGGETEAGVGAGAGGRLRRASLLKSVYGHEEI